MPLVKKEHKKYRSLSYFKKSYLYQALKPNQTEYTLPQYDFLGPGTGLDKKKILDSENCSRPNSNRTWKMMKNHTLILGLQTKKCIKTAIETGLTGIISAGIIAAKHYIGTDKLFC